MHGHWRSDLNICRGLRHLVQRLSSQMVICATRKHNVSTNVYSSYYVLYYSLLLHDHYMTKTLKYAGLSVSNKAVFNKYEDC